jgi:hypothetical protein
MSEDKDTSKLRLSVVDNGKKSPEPIIDNLKSAKVQAIKPIKCYIYLCRFKECPTIQFTQIRFEVFDDVSLALPFCESMCSEYEIRSHKDNKTLVKFKEALTEF